MGNDGIITLLSSLVWMAHADGINILCGGRVGVSVVKRLCLICRWTRETCRNMQHSLQGVPKGEGENEFSQK